MCIIRQDYMRKQKTRLNLGCLVKLSGNFYFLDALWIRLLDISLYIYKLKGEESMDIFVFIIKKKSL
jgi:hypothetical protein